MAAKLLAEVDLQGPGQRGAVKDLCKTFHAQVRPALGPERRRHTRLGGLGMGKANSAQRSCRLPT